MQEWRSQAELESQISHPEHKLELLVDKLSQSEYKLSLRENQLHFNSDSENEEFLNTIETQKLQILTLEDSLRLKKENIPQLQHIFEVKRGRGKAQKFSQVSKQIHSLQQTELESLKK